MSPGRIALAAALAVAAVAAAAFLALRADPPRPPEPPAPRPAARFEERAREAGLAFRMSFLPEEQGERFKVNLYDHGSGLAVADVDADGDDDLLLLNQLGANALYRNDGKGSFVDVTATAGGVALRDRICVAASFADVDGDGDQDLYVTSTRGGNVFFRNAGGASFEDDTERSGLSLVAHSQTPAFFDADADGDLDLLVTNTARWTLDEYDEGARYWLGPATLWSLVASAKERNVYYRNRGDGTFEEATAESGLAGEGWDGDTAVFDADDDGDLDVFVGNMFGASALYRNDGKGRFSDATKEVLGRTSWGTIGAKPLDHDGDGRLDLLVVDMHSDMWTDPAYPVERIERSSKYDSPNGPLVAEGLLPRAKAQEILDLLRVRPREVVFGNTLFRNLGGGRFRETSDAAGAETLWPWGVAAGDFDADGFEDVFLPSGMGYPWEYVPSPFLHNRGDGTFRDRAAEWGTEPPPDGPHLPETYGGARVARSARAAATADFDGDGRLDLVVNHFNDRAHLWMNRGPVGRWVAFRLRGAGKNRDATGALVTVRAGGRTFVRQVHATGGYLAQSSRTLHVGLGAVDAIESCEVRWPRGRVQALPPPALDATHVVVEPSSP